MKKEKIKKVKKGAVEENKEELVSQSQDIEQVMKINKSTLKDLLAPSGIDASHFDYLEIFSKISRYARTFYVTTLPRQATFPYFLSNIYEFGDVNTSVYIHPISETLP